jgi:phosphate uptake regulator
MSETRKLQRIGGNTLYVSLPKRWTNRMQLKQGDKVTLTPQLDGSMSIYPTAKKEKSRDIILEINANDSRQSLKRGITAAYVDGFDVIKLKASERLTEEQQNVAREIIDHMFGLELIEVTGNTMTIQCLLKQDLPIEKTILRIHNVILSMFSETISALEEQDINSVKGLTRRMHDIKRLSLVTNRLLRSLILFPRSAEQKEVSLIDSVDYLRVLHIIAEIAENVNKISESSLALSEQTLPMSILKPLSQTCVPVQDLYDQSIQALLSKDISLANRVLDSKLTLDNLWNLCREADEKSEISSLALSHAYLLIDNLKQIQQYTIEIAEIAIDRAEATITDGQNIGT